MNGRVRKPNESTHAQSSILLASILMQNNKSFSNLGGHGLLRLKQMKELKVVHLQQHASDLAGQFRLSTIVIN
jgi:hypothetical protein